MSLQRQPIPLTVDAMPIAQGPMTGQKPSHPGQQTPGMDFRQGPVALQQDATSTQAAPQPTKASDRIREQGIQVQRSMRAIDREIEKIKFAAQRAGNTAASSAIVRNKIDTWSNQKEDLAGQLTRLDADYKSALKEEDGIQTDMEKESSRLAKADSASKRAAALGADDGWVAHIRSAPDPEGALNDWQQEVLGPRQVAEKAAIDRGRTTSRGRADDFRSATANADALQKELGLTDDQRDEARVLYQQGASDTRVYNAFAPKGKKKDEDSADVVARETWESANNRVNPLPRPFGGKTESFLQEALKGELSDSVRGAIEDERFARRPEVQAADSAFDDAVRSRWPEFGYIPDVKETNGKSVGADTREDIAREAFNAWVAGAGASVDEETQMRVMDRIRMFSGLDPL